MVLDMKVPLFVAFMELRRLPARDFGPVDSWAFRRFAASFLSETGFGLWVPSELRRVELPEVCSIPELLVVVATAALRTS
jgi:hypothetical protein